jgi:hypothetical protein
MTVLKQTVLSLIHFAHPASRDKAHYLEPASQDLAAQKTRTYGKGVCALVARR